MNLMKTNDVSDLSIFGFDDSTMEEMKKFFTKEEIIEPEKETSDEYYIPTAKSFYNNKFTF